MKSVSNEFLGALFGAWAGIVTELWKKPPIVMILFLLAIVAISFLLSILSATKEKYIKIGAVALLIILAPFSGVVFTYFPGLEIFTSNQLGFYYCILFSWLLVGIIMEPLYLKVSSLKIIDNSDLTEGE